MTSSDQLVNSPPASPVVFVIESDSSLRRLLDASAEHALWRIQPVSCLRTLLELQRTAIPSCLVLDATQAHDELPAQPCRGHMPFICVIEPGDVSLSVRAMKAGALDVLTKPVGGASLFDAVRLALRHSEEYIRKEAELNRMRSRYASLSRREREVMSLVAAGLMNKRVADDLGISVITVKAHRGRVMRKMKAKSFANLVMMSILLQLPPPDQLTRSAPARVAFPTPTDERYARLDGGLARQERTPVGMRGV